MRPPRQVIVSIDHLVDRLDRKTLQGRYRPGVTSSYERIAAAWECFKARVDRLDLAVARLFADNAPSVLLTADALVGVDVEKLAFWLGHVGEAIRAS
jgi:hypothetical protein